MGPLQSSLWYCEKVSKGEQEWEGKKNFIESFRYRKAEIGWCSKCEDRFRRAACLFFPSDVLTGPPSFKLGKPNNKHQFNKPYPLLIQNLQRCGPFWKTADLWFNSGSKEMGIWWWLIRIHYIRVSTSLQNGNNHNLIVVTASSMSLWLWPSLRFSHHTLMALPSILLVDGAAHVWINPGAEKMAGPHGWHLRDSCC